MNLQKNTPEFWLPAFPRLPSESHKYTRGHALIYAAPELTGASRLAAESCARIGAGLVSVLCTKESAVVYKSALPAHILVRDNLLWCDDRVTAQLYGSGGLSCKIDLKDMPTVLDADALTALPSDLNDRCVLTPHEGEFQKLFPNLSGDRNEKAQEAARKSGAIVVLKGAETLIAHPDGRVVKNNHASPYLATAGTGDVLAGMITGLLAQGMSPFEASCAAVWIHGESAIKHGPGMVASDICNKIPEILQDLSLNFTP